jgi:Holliday junction resolvase
MPSTAKKGADYEKQVEETFRNKGYKTHRNIKSRFGTQDIFGIGDILATTSDIFVIAACAVGRAQTATVKKIEAIRPYLPKEIKVLYFIKKKGKEEVREY